MKVQLRFIIIFLSIASAVILFASCDSGNNSAALSESQFAAENEAVSQPEEARIALTRDGNCQYTVIRADIADTDIVTACSQFVQTLKSMCTVNNININTDWVKRGIETPVYNEDYEILIGNTNRAETAQALEELNAVTGYTIRLIGNKIVIAGTDTDQVVSALNQFISDLSCDSGCLSIPVDYNHSYMMGEEGSSIWHLMNEYTICVSNKSQLVTDAVNKMRQEMIDMTGLTITSTAVSADGNTITNTKKEILIGNTNRVESSKYTDLKFQDYVIESVGNKIIIQGGSSYATAQALYEFEKLFKSDNIDEICNSKAGYQYIYRFVEVRADSLMYNMDSFIPLWTTEFTVPAWMLDFEEKTYAITCPTGRFCSDAHRGDTDHYPENSAEGIYSSVLIGADCIEIDIRLTKDYVPVLMHDETLTRTTDYTSKAGKNGLPSSAYICDWTYDQLMQLNLKMNDNVTVFKICTLYEAVALACGRCFLHMDDKAANLHVNTDVFQLGVEFNAKESFLYTYGLAKMQLWVRLDTSDIEFAGYIKQVENYLKISGHSFVKRDFSYLETFGDNEAAWEKIVQSGIRMLFTNNLLDMQKYLAENYKPSM